MRVHRSWSFVFPFVLQLGCISIGAAAQQATDAGPSPEAITSFLNEFMPAAMEQYHIPGAAVSFVTGGEVTAMGYGVADRTSSRPVTAHTPFRVASVSKTITAIAVLKLAESGAISLDEDLGSDKNTEALRTILIRLRTEEPMGPITPARLLTHTAGLEEARPADRFVDPSAAVPLGDYLAKRMPARVRPAGEVISYSNFGYGLLAYFVELRSGHPFPEFVRREILSPAAMPDSTFDQRSPELRDELAKGYDYREGAYHELPFRYHNSVGDGAFASSAADMARVITMLLSGGELAGTRILNESSVTKMSTQQFTHHPRLPGVCFGLFEDVRGGHRILMHTGSMDEGFESLLFLVPEIGTGLFVVYNQRNSNLRIDLLDKFIDRFLPSVAAPSQPFPVSDLTQYASRYGHVRYSRAAPASTRPSVHIAVTSSALVLEADGVVTTWTPLGDDLFQESRSGRLLAFRRNSNGVPVFVFLGADAYERMPK